MRTLTKIGDSLDGVFTLQNRVRKMLSPMGETGPHWAPHGAPWGTPWGPPYQSMGDFAPMGAPISIDGGTVMPMGETNGNEMCWFIRLN